MSTGFMLLDTLSPKPLYHKVFIFFLTNMFWKVLYFSLSKYTNLDFP